LLMFSNMNHELNVEAQTIDADIVCVGCGPAASGFLYTLSVLLKDYLSEQGSSEAKVPQIICYERADDLAFGVSGVVTKARSILKSLPELATSQLPLLGPVVDEKLVYLMDPIGASRRGSALRFTDWILSRSRRALGKSCDHFELPIIPSFLHKTGGLTFSLGQFTQYVSARIMEMGLVQLWPASPVAEPLIENRRVVGVKLADQGVDLEGKPGDAFMPGINVRAGLTVVADGPVGVVGRAIDKHFGVPAEYRRDDWAVGMKLVVGLPESCELSPGTVFHTFGYPEPEIFGFMYVHPGQVASLGIFVPTWFKNPVRSSYRYLQHWMQHPYLWKHLRDATMKSWGAKSLQESGRRAEPLLAGDGFARIGEGSGTTNILTGSGVDEAWESGVLLAESVMELWRRGLPFSQANLERTYVQRRRNDWLELEARAAERSRDGFTHGILWGLLGMGISGVSGGRLNLPVRGKGLDPLPNIESFFAERLSAAEIADLRRECATRGKSLHDALMDRCGWPTISYDGKLLMSQQDALLLGGKVQAPPGYANHVQFVYPRLCQECGSRLCVEICSGQAITPTTDGVPAFDREKCIHCGACYWSCSQTIPENPHQHNLDFRVGAGGLHSVEN
jgi:electron-transferring-flavoprotein dehydrogenase